MFSQPIVFVIGAGASVEFGLPGGADMKKKLAETLNFNKRNDGQLFGDRAVYDLLGNRFGQQAADRQNDATELAARIGEFESIDEALHWFSGRPNIVSIGKAAIVREILQSERTSGLFNQQNPDIIPSKVYAETWLPHFLSMLVSSLRREQSLELFRNVSLINFNYDRTIEHYLYSRLRTDFGFEPAEAIDAISTLAMIRPYGSVGPLPWQREGGIGVSFGEYIGDHERLFQLAENVRTYTEQNLAHELRFEIRSAIDSARLVVFLGFGFHQQNMTLLQSGQSQPWRRALGSVFRIDQENFETMKLKIAGIIGCQSPSLVQLLPRRTHELLVTMRPTIMAAL